MGAVGLAPAPPTTVRLLAEATRRLAAAGIATARPDAETLLAHAATTTRLGLYTTLADPVAPAAAARFASLVERRLRHEPLQYLVGETEFCGLRLRVGPGVFIPRPETEALVSRALAGTTPGPARVLELCTGSGAIACALAAQRPAWSIDAGERDPAALAWARANVTALGLATRVALRQGDLFAAWGEPAAGIERPVDLVVANPPYLAASVVEGLPAEVRDWEPGAALVGGPDGLAVVRRLVADAPGWLRPGGHLLLEIGEDQGPAARALVATDGRYGEATVHRDFRGAERILEAWRR